MVMEQRETIRKSPERAQPAPEGGTDVLDTRISKREGGDAEERVTQSIREAERLARSGRVEKDPLLVRIETALSENLSDEYAQLPQVTREVFRKEGEQLAHWLHIAFLRGTLHPHEVLTHIEKWLLIIEGKDRVAPWLLQEAYIRTRRFLRMARDDQRGH